MSGIKSAETLLSSPSRADALEATYDTVKQRLHNPQARVPGWKSDQPPGNGLNREHTGTRVASVRDRSEAPVLVGPVSVQPLRAVYVTAADLSSSHRGGWRSAATAGSGQC